ncbi:MAG TPA: hypothetical protein VE595_05630 [Nitrososphaeraceae archaeon]|nr:hypothetical protein [Nitrososphaeraceae archaeon]
MFHHHNDHKFQKIIDEFILSSTDDQQLSHTIRNIDYEAAKLGISFYQMMFILIQKDAINNNRRKKKWLIQKLREIIILFM